MKTSFGKKASGLRLERMQASPRWMDGAFQNLHPILPGLRASGAKPSLRDFLCAGGRRTPPAPLPVHDPREAWLRAPRTGLRATWLGHSTVLLEIDGVCLLTDPVWGDRASPVAIAGPRRFQPVPVSLADLPPLDAVLVSHDHYDHLDYTTMLELSKSDVPFITSLGVGAHLESWGIAERRIYELDWWESFDVRGVRVTAAPSQHFSGRTLGSRNATLWSSFALRSERHSVFFSGDTGLTTEYQSISEKLGPFELVMLEVGAFHPAWGDIHLGPENALEALSLLGGGAFLPIHWGTFNLALHPWDEPAEVLLKLAPRTSARLLMPKIGQAIEPALGLPLTPWWRPVTKLEDSVPESDDAPPSPAGANALSWPLD
jgi:L-ascorbate metabolism protein UlaG (beta-lactamase superfamily)